MLWAWSPAAGDQPPTSALLWRGAHHAHDPPLLLLVAPDAARNSTGLVWLDANTGAESGGERLAIGATRVVPLPAADASGRRVVLLWDEVTGAVAAFPPGPEAEAIVAERAEQGLLLTRIALAEAAAAGYSLRPAAGAGAQKEAAAWAAVPLWHVAFAGAIVAHAAPADDQASQAPQHNALTADSSICYPMTRAGIELRALACRCCSDGHVCLLPYSD